MEAEQFGNIVRLRYATKRFNGKIIPQEYVEKLFEMIRFAPSSYNLQPFKIRVITDKILKEKLRPASNNQEQITTCSHLLIFCVHTDVNNIVERVIKTMRISGSSEESIKRYDDMVRGFLTKKTREELIAWASNQAFLALENVLLGAKSLGFDSCPMEGFNSAEYSKILNLPETLVPSVLCTIGYASDKPRAKVRVSKEELFF